MNQKLRTARSGMVILFAVLCIVCLSLSLALSAHFAAYAEEENSATLGNNDGKGHDLWLIHYDGQEAGESLWNGIHDDKPISYIGSVKNEDGVYPVCEGGEEENYFAPYRGKTLTIALNPDYETENGTLGSLYDLEKAKYDGAYGDGDIQSSTDMNTKVTVQPLEESSATEPLVLEKQWMIATLCNTVDIQGVYIPVSRSYGDPANYSLLRPIYGDTVVYDISSTAGYEKIIAVKYEQNSEKYLQAGKGLDGYFVTTEAWDPSEVSAAVEAKTNLINYIIRRLEALEATSDRRAYTLTVTAMETSDDGISYAQSSKSYDFSVIPLPLGNDAENAFETFFKYTFINTSVEYTSDSEWIKKIGFTLSLNNGNTVLEEGEGQDYTISAVEYGVGLVDLYISGSRNLSGYHTIKGAIRITPARNEWSTTPNIVTWVYGTYNANNNLIVGVPKFLDNPNDITFRIVKLTKNSEEDIEGLTDIHYYVYEEEGILKTDYIVTEDVIAILKNLDAGTYRLYASVYGASSMAQNPDRNYQPIEEASVDFSVFKGTNSWKAGSEPTVRDGGWIEGKLDTIEGIINAEPELLDEGEKTILMIYRVTNKPTDDLIYSNIHSAGNGSGVATTLDVLKGLKAGRYYLSAEVEGTDNYSGLKTTVLFTVNPNNLPVWAVILIVAGALGLVALVFGILHQKGVLQMLTGKVLLSMRTRANVDATLAAIRAAKVAREAEASIAAAKAREAEEQAKKENK